MKKLFIIGGMGAGKSTARKALVDQGLPYVDLDQVGHDVLLWDTVKGELVETFGADILGSDGEIVRGALAAKAFVAESSRSKNSSSSGMEQAMSSWRMYSSSLYARAPSRLRMERASVRKAWKVLCCRA